MLKQASSPQSLKNNMENLVLIAPLAVLVVAVAAYFFSKKNTTKPSPTPSPAPTPVISSVIVPPQTGSLPTVPGSLTVTTNTGFVSGTGTTSAITNAAFVSVSGGSGNYTYLWSRVSGVDSFGLNGNLTPTVTCQYGGLAGSYSMVFKCTVTDTVTGAVGVSNNVTAQITLTA